MENTRKESEHTCRRRKETRGVFSLYAKRHKTQNIFDIGWDLLNIVCIHKLLYSTTTIFCTIQRKELPDIELKLSLYIAVVICRPIWEKILRHGTETTCMFPLSRVVIFRLYGKKIHEKGTEIMFPISCCCYFPYIMGEKIL